MASQQLLFIFSHPPDHELAAAAWDAAMTAGLLSQKVTILFSGAGLEQLKSQQVVDKISDLRGLFPLRLCVDTALPEELGMELESIMPLSHSAFQSRFQRILSF